MKLRGNDLPKNRNSSATDVKIKKAVTLGGWQLMVYEANRLWDGQVGSIVEYIIPDSYGVSFLSIFRIVA